MSVADTVARRPAPNGQALAEFALVGGIFFLVVLAIIQFGLILWSANTLTQVTRDAARWAVTESTTPCESGPSRTALASQADLFARQWNLLGYRAGTWTNAGPISSLAGPGIAADWPIPTGSGPLFASDCPPSNNSVAWFVRVRIDHAVPIFLPGLQLVAPSCGVPGILSVVDRRAANGAEVAMKKFNRRFVGGEEGQVLPLAALMLVALIAIVGLAIDVSGAFMEQRWQRSITDGASLAGGQDLQMPGRLLPEFDCPRRGSHDCDDGRCNPARRDVDPRSSNRSELRQRGRMSAPGDTVPSIGLCRR